MRSWQTFKNWWIILKFKLEEQTKTAQTNIQKNSFFKLIHTFLDNQFLYLFQPNRWCDRKLLWCRDLDTFFPAVVVDVAVASLSNDTTNGTGKIFIPKSKFPFYVFAHTVNTTMKSLIEFFCCYSDFLCLLILFFIFLNSFSYWKLIDALCMMCAFVIQALFA